VPFTLSKQRKKQNQWLSVLLRLPRSKFYNLHQRSVSWGKAPKQREKSKKKSAARGNERTLLSLALSFGCTQACVASISTWGLGTIKRLRNGIHGFTPSMGNQMVTSEIRK